MSDRPRFYTGVLQDHLQRHRQMALISGPRQVGKTTVCRALGDAYFNWDNTDDRRLLLRGPAALAASLGMKLATLDEVKAIDLTVDGADEIGPGLSLIKGGGAALLREKLVWEASRRCVVIADAAKVVGTLGAFALPIEVVKFGHFHTQARICDALALCDIEIAARWRKTDGAPVETDGGNYVYDAACGAIPDPAMLADALKAVTGVVDIGTGGPA